MNTEMMPHLCWSCENAVPDKHGRGCPWSRKLQPVPGWIAKKTNKSADGDSCHIIGCPLYAPDGSEPQIKANAYEEKKPARISNEKVMPLYEAGYTDKMISISTGFSKAAIFNWRKRNGLPSQTDRKKAMRYADK